MKLKKKTIVIAILDLLAIICLVVVYVIPSFKTWWITTSVSTGKHKWFADIFYSNSDIKKALTNNQVVELDEEVNLDEITFENTEVESYDSIYDEQVLKRDKDALYKLIDIKEKGYRGYMVAVYDPSRIKLAIAPGYGHTLRMLAKENGAKVAINASGFDISSATANGVVIKDGKLVDTDSSRKDYQKTLELLIGVDSDTFANAVEFGPFLIINGKAATIKGNGGMGVANRTVIAQRKDGIVLFLVIDGRGANNSKGIDMNGLIKILTRYKAYNAANLDGGGSSTLVINNKLINNPRGYYGDNWERPLPNAWIIK